MSKLSSKIFTTTLPYTIVAADTDMFARIRIGVLVNLFIQAAIVSANKMGFGYSNIRQQQLFWVLSRLTVQIEKPLKWDDNIEIITWPKTTDRLFYLRDFLVYDKNKNVVVRATSGWLAIDLKTKRPKNIETRYMDFFTKLKDKYAIECPPVKLNPIKNGNPFEVRSTYFDIDLNKHVTSSRYVDWMMDTLSYNFHKTHYPTFLSINYLKETMPKETIVLKRKQNNESSFSFCGINENNVMEVVRGQIDF